MPVSAGKHLKSCVNASNPPADAPIPTMGNAVFPAFHFSADANAAAFDLCDFLDAELMRKVFCNDVSSCELKNSKKKSMNPSCDYRWQMVWQRSSTPGI
jgi:hypothetical protein